MTDPRSSVVFISNADRDDGELHHAKGLLGCKIHNIAGGGYGIYGFGNEGVYEVTSGTQISGVDLACGSVGLDIAVGVSSTIERNFSPPKATGPDADKGSVYSWGLGDLGELGLGPSRTDESNPRRINYDRSVAFTQISSGEHHSAAVDSRGNLYAWGQNFSKQLGLFTKSVEAMRELRSMAATEDLLFTPRFVPSSLQRPVAKVACGAYFTVVITKSGQVWSWGAGECGQLGTGRCTSRELPAQVHLVPIPSDATGKKAKKPVRRGKDNPVKKDIVAADIACGSGHAIAVTDKGALYSWGLNKSGQLGLGDTETRHSPAEVSIKATDATEVHLETLYAYCNVSAGLDRNGRLWTWGSAASGRLLRPALPPVDPKATDEASKRDAASTMSLRALGSTIRASNAASHGQRRGSVNSIEIVQPSVWPYSASPGVVSSFENARVHKFAFYSHGSAAVVQSTLESLSPSSGPIKGFSQLRISGYGFWDSEKIIVKFSLQNSEVPPRSCSGRLGEANVIVCRPPKLNETGTYNVTVSMDGGKTFLPQILSLRAYKETAATGISPKMIDLRKTSTEKVVLSCKHLHVFDEGMLDEDDHQMWPMESDIKEHLFVKLLVSCSPPGNAEPTISEALFPATLVPLESLSYDSVVNADGSVSQNGSVSNQGSRVEANGSVDAGPSIDSLAEGSSIDGGSYASSHVSFPDRDVECEVDFSKLGPPGSLIMIRGAFCLNGHDFGIASPETTPIICHSFSPNGASPSCCPADQRFDAEGEPCSREITILGSSFIPTSMLPAGMSIEACIRCEVPGGAKGKPSIVEKIVSIECESADSIRVQMPTLVDLCAPGTTLPPKASPGLDGADDSSRPATAKCAASKATAQVYFRLNVPPPTEKGGKKSARTPTSASPSKKGTAKKEVVPMLAENPVSVYLYEDSPITISPQLTRRAGGAELTLLAPQNDCGGFNFNTSDAKVEFYRSDLDIVVSVPIADTYMLGIDEEIPVAEPEPVRDQDEEDEDDEQANDETEQQRNLGNQMSALSLDGASTFIGDAGPSMISAHDSLIDGNVSAAGSVAGSAASLQGGSLATAQSVKPQPSRLEGIGQPHKIIIKCPEICMPQRTASQKANPDLDAAGGVGISESIAESTTGKAGEASAENVDAASSAVDAADAAGEDSPADVDGAEVAANEEENDAAESVYVMPLDFMHVRVLLDGRSSVAHENSTFVSLYYKVEPSDEDVEVAGGAASAGSQCTLQVYSGAVPSDAVMVRLRGEGGEAVVIEAEVQCESAATPGSVDRLYAQEAAAAAAAEENVEGGSGDGEDAEEGDVADEEGGDAEEGDGEGEEGEGEVEPEPEEEGFLDTGGGGGAVVFDCPDLSMLEPVMDGNNKRVFVDVSLDGGETWDEATEPRLTIK